MRRPIDSLAEARTISVRRLPAEPGEPLGHPARSHYVERFWLPVLGPSTTLLVRLLAEMLEATGRVTVDVADTARALGLGERLGPSGPFFRTLARAVDFDVVRVAGTDAIAARTHLGALSRRHIARLPDQLRRAHPAATTALDVTRRRAEQLALSLLDLGADRTEIERQLVAWRFDARLASEAASLAARSRRRTSEEVPAARGAPTR